MKPGDDEFNARKELAIEKGIEVDDKGVPQADPYAIRNFGEGDVVKFETDQGVLSGVMLGFDKDGFAIVTVDGNDWRVTADKLQDGMGGL